MPLLGSNNNLDVTITTRQEGSGISDAEKQIAALGKTSEESTGKVGGLVGAVESFGNKLKTMGEYFISYQIVTEIENAFKAIIGGAGELEQTNMAFQSMIGNVQEANSVFGQLVQYANTTPFQSSQIESAARTLMGFGTAGQQTVDIIKQLGDVVSVGGGDLQALSLVTGQIFAQGKLRAQDMYQVINDGGAGLIRIMANSVGGMKKLTAEFDSGGIPAQQYFDAVNTAVAQGGFAFQGAQKQAETFNGRLSTLADAAKLTGLALLGVKLDPVLGLQVQPGGLFDQMKGGILGITDALQSLQPKLETIMPQFIAEVHKLWDQLFNYLGPSLRSLWTTIQTQLIPSFRVFWHEVIEPLIPVLGKGLVVALYLIINGLNELIKVISAILVFIPQIPAKFLAAFTAIKNGVDELRDQFFFRLGQVTAFFITLPILWPKYLADAIDKMVALIQKVDWGKVFGPIKDALVQAFKDALEAIGRIDWGGAAKNYAGNVFGAELGALKSALNGALSTLPGSPHFATGVTNFSGGLAMVGDVPGGYGELVELPRGANVYTNAQSQSMLNKGMPAGKQVTIHQTNNIYTQFDMAIAARELGFRLAHA